MTEGRLIVDKLRQDRIKAMQDVQAGAHPMCLQAQKIEAARKEIPPPLTEQPEVVEHESYQPMCMDYPPSVSLGASRGQYPKLIQAEVQELFPEDPDDGSEANIDDGLSGD